MNIFDLVFKCFFLRPEQQSTVHRKALLLNYSVFSYMNTMLFNRYQKLPLICMQMTLEDVQKIGNDLKVEI